MTKEKRWLCYENEVMSPLHQHVLLDISEWKRDVEGCLFLNTFSSPMCCNFYTEKPARLHLSGPVFHSVSHFIQSMGLWKSSCKELWPTKNINVCILALSKDGLYCKVYYTMVYANKNLHTFMWKTVIEWLISFFLAVTVAYAVIAVA